MFHVKQRSAVLTYVSRETLVRYGTIFRVPGGRGGRPVHPVRAARGADATANLPAAPAPWRGLLPDRFGKRARPPRRRGRVAALSTIVNTGRKSARRRHFLRHARTRSIAVRFSFSAPVPCPREAVSAPPVVTPDLIRGPGKPGEGGACGPGPRIKSGVTTGGKERRVWAGCNPCPDPAEGPETRLYQRLAPGPAHLNRTAVDSFRA